MQTVEDFQELLAATAWGRAAAARGLNAHALARPMARVLWLRHSDPALCGDVRPRYVVAELLGYGVAGSRRVRQLERRALRLLRESREGTDEPRLRTALSHSR